MGKFLKKFTKVTLALLMCLGVMDLTAFKPVEVQAAEEHIRADKTLTDDDGDGVYELALTITGSSQSSSSTEVDKSNVIIVMDRSNSMSNNTYVEYVYDSATFDSNTHYYRQTTDWYGRVSYERVYYRNGAWRTGNGNNDAIYSGTVYARMSRIDAEQAALDDVVKNLLANNKDEDGLRDIIEISIIGYALYSPFRNDRGNVVTATQISNSSNYDDIMSAVNNNSQRSGTNWDDALREALREANALKRAEPDEDIHIVFLTDGEPTASHGDDRYTTTYWRHWGNANTQATAIVDAGYNFYSIFTYGDNNTYINYLNNLTRSAHGVGTYTEDNFGNTNTYHENFYNATDTSELVEAFEKIVNKINKNVGYAGVEYQDGVTLGVTNTSITVDGEIKSDSFHYTVLEGNKEKYSVSFKTEGSTVTATFKINGKNYTTTERKEHKADLNGDGADETYYYYSVTVGDTEYKMAPATMNSDGLVDWELAGLGILENGYTYKLTFDVWPNQLAYDMVADLNNGVKTLSEIKADVVNRQGTAKWEQIEKALVVSYKDSEGTHKDTLNNLSDEVKAGLENGTIKATYSILTNYLQSVEYYTADEETNEETGETTTTYTSHDPYNPPQPDAVELTSTTMELEKVWDDSLDEAQLAELLWKDYESAEPSDPTKYRVPLIIWKSDSALTAETVQKNTNTVAIANGLDAKSSYEAIVAAFKNQPDYYMTKILGWDEALSGYSWMDSLEVAPGTLVTLEAAQEMGATIIDSHIVSYEGTDYYILESGHYYTVSEIGTDRHFELNTIVYHPMLVNRKVSNVTFTDQKDANGHTIIESIVPMSSVDAYNTLKGGINILKRAYDDKAEILASDDTFTVKVTMKDADGEPYTDFDYRVYYGENNPNYKDAEKYPKHRSGHVFGTNAAVPSDNTNPTVTGNEPGENEKAILNNKDGIVTLNLYLGDTVRIINVPAGVTYSVEETMVNDIALVDGKAEGYKYSSIIYEIGDKTGDSDQVVYVPDNAHTVVGNHANQATVKNEVPSTELVVLKTGTVENKDGLSGVKFKMYYDAELKQQVVKDALGDPFGDPNAENKVTSGSDGKIVLGTFVPGTYYLKETDTVTGYELLTEAIAITVKADGSVEGADENGIITITNKEVVDYSVEKKWNAGDDNVPESLTVNLYTVNGQEETIVSDVEPLVLNEGNSWKGKWTDLPKYDEKGNAIKYVAKEVEIEGFISESVTGEYSATITNTEKTEASVKKVWEDANNQDGKRPESLTVTLLANGIAAKDKDGKDITVTLSETNGWTESVSDLPKYAGESEISYSWSEPTIKGYTQLEPVVEGELTTLTNKHETEKINVSATKIWKDNNNHDGKRANVTFQLQVNGKPVEGQNDKTIVKSAEGNDLTVTWTDLPKYAKGSEIDYKVVEVGESGGKITMIAGDPDSVYDVKVEGDKTKGFTITNSHSDAKMKLTVKKVWNDNSDQDGKRASQNKDGFVVLYMTPEGGEPKPFDTNKTKLVFDNDEYIVEGYNQLEVPVYDGGKKLTYSVEETLPESSKYKSEVSAPVVASNGADATIIVTNTHEPEKITIKATKEWEDSDNQDGKRADVKFELQVGGNPVTSLPDGQTAQQTISKDATGNDLTVTWTDLPKYANKTEIDYKVVELNVVDGKITMKENDPDSVYTVEITGDKTTGFTIKNTHNPIMVTSTVTKVWVDEDNQDGIRPEELAVTLSDGTKRTLTEDADGKWTATVTNLPKYKDGEVVVYSWTENKVPKDYKVSYSQSGNDTTITNTHTPATIDVKATKVWDDNNNHDGKRADVIFELQVDGKAVEGLTDEQTAQQTIKKDATGDALIVKWTNLPQYADGNEIDYKVVEKNVVDGKITMIAGDSDSVYDVKVEGNKTDGFKITNSHSDVKIKVEAQKIWDDADNQDGMRAAVTINLLADGTETGKSATIAKDAKDDDLKVSWSALDKYDATGKEITYTVKEVGESEGKITMIAGEDDSVYTVTYGGDHKTGLTVTNKHETVLTERTVKKVWNDASNQDGKRPESLTVALLADNQAALDSDGKAITVELNEDNSWSATVENLPKYNSGSEIAYSWTEGALPKGYELTNTKTEGLVTTLTNSYKPETKNLTVNKVWDDDGDRDGIRPDSLTVALLADNQAALDSEGKAITVELNEDNSWSATVENLPVYKNAGTRIVYSWDEGQLPEGYKLTDTIGNGNITTLKNTHVIEKTEATVKKVWDDDKDRDGLRPESLNVNLMNGEKVVATVTLNEDNGWTATVNNLPVKENHGTTITYSWTETGLPEGYSLSSSTTEGKVTTITNKHEIAKTEATVKKVWDDVNNQDGKRPTSLTVTLSDGQKVTLNEENGWTATITGLPVYENGGKPITYTWTEADIAEYTLSNTAKEGTVTTLTNSYVPKQVSIVIEKIWDDANNQDGKRPNPFEAVIVLKGNDDSSRNIKLNDANQWTYTESGLPRYKNGKEITYSVDELEITDYNTTIVKSDAVNDGKGNMSYTFTVTNTHKPELVEVSVTKVWDDADDQDGIRPESIEVTLSTGDKVTLTERNNWSGSIKDLPKYKDGGQLITYSWTEANVPEGYELKGNVADGYVTTITNFHKPEETEAEIVKVWDDMENRDLTRQSVTMKLMKKGADGNTPVLDSTGKAITVTLSEENKWDAKVEHLDKNAAGKPIEYVWEEDIVDGYEQVSNVTEGTVTTITNRLKRVDLTIEKEVDKIVEAGDNLTFAFKAKVVDKTTKEVRREYTVGITLGKNSTTGKTTIKDIPFDNETDEFVVEEVYTAGYKLEEITLTPSEDGSTWTAHAKNTYNKIVPGSGIVNKYSNKTHEKNQTRESEG